HDARSGRLEPSAVALALGVLAIRAVGRRPLARRVELEHPVFVGTEIAGSVEPFHAPRAVRVLRVARALEAVLTAEVIAGPEGFVARVLHRDVGLLDHHAG